MSDPFQLGDRLRQRREQHLYRRRRALHSAQGTHIQCDGKPLLNFCSNDYLSLANHPRLISAAKKAVNTFGVGSGASHLVIGHSCLHQQLEERLADWVGRPRALLFSTGYMANMGVISALLKRGDTVFQDKVNHASLLDGAQLSRARLVRYPHCDTEHLQRLLSATDTPSLVVTDSIFSMDGDVAPLMDMARTCQNENAWLMVDDAHGLGVLGRGKGVLAEYNLSQSDVPVYMATLGKALGSYGAFVAGSDDLIEFLIQFSRSYIYTTAIPPAIAAASLESLSLLETETWRIDRLHSLIDYFRRAAAARQLPILSSQSAIQPFKIGDSERAVQISEKLQACGILVGAIRPPTVPVNTARLRITLQADHQEIEIDQLLDTLVSVFHQTDQQ
ncbi:8-amino-7-oxononanoate synthase [Ketobacter sp. MCCC 1A13808]|uniref:8-amino-7-oxononanoate synthase n=1 Tax=Ketobacter sp. MCCC 1A13808 TaxID=2602738 RepID=UPI0012EC324A|nr:8-amino-7-oxononanoate synthase [Ketobacter sp. MCCC 1A13808]MVF14616.1 8-amino-7-oxononanoate synthase [Ketobacter sp. MCCC 1A13808]